MEMTMIIGNHIDATRAFATNDFGCLDGSPSVTISDGTAILGGRKRYTIVPTITNHTVTRMSFHFIPNYEGSFPYKYNRPSILVGELGEVLTTLDDGTTSYRMDYDDGVNSFVVDPLVADVPGFVYYVVEFLMSDGYIKSFACTETSTNRSLTDQNSQTSSSITIDLRTDFRSSDSGTFVLEWIELTDITIAATSVFGENVLKTRFTVGD